MDEDQYGMELLGAISSAELARVQRRVLFLEAALAQLLRDRGQLREWFSASELTAMRLPGMPQTRNGVTHLARARGWEASIVTGRGGERQLYHFSCLPRRAFEGMINLVLRAAAPDASEGSPNRPVKLPAVAVAVAVAVTAPIGPHAGAGEDGPPALDSNVTPPWVLPLMQIMRGGAVPLDLALGQLPEPVACPSLAEARAVLGRLGVAV